MPTYRPLPYPGHSWYLTQHAVGIEPQTLYKLLECAAPFQGQEKFGHKATELMIAAQVLTSNVRGGTPDAWRDYQQVLSELGLIVSTLASRTLIITELGRKLLAGEIGFAELIGIQALRYQYPNGHKYIIQSRLRRVLEEASVSVPATLTELQTENGVLLKPGVLILRTLLELLDSSAHPSLSVSECQAFLIPCKLNSDVDIVVADILAHRGTQENIDHINRHARRNIQDWFKLLTKTDFFQLSADGDLFLSNYSLAHLEIVEEYCTNQEHASSFWIPPSFDPAGRLNWFDWFGSLPSWAQLGMRTDLGDDPQYTRENYVEGIDDEEEDQQIIPGTGALNLRPIDLSTLGVRSTPQVSEDIETLLENLRRGIQKRHSKTLLHDSIIKQLAERFISQGALVESDPDSIDLFAKWPAGNTAIFEVKTVTQRNLQLRLRTAIGQVEEYAFRRKVDTGHLSDRIVVLNAQLGSSAWQVPFLRDYLGIGLICTTKDAYNAAAPSDSTSYQNWL